MGMKKTLFTFAVVAASLVLTLSLRAQETAPQTPETATTDRQLPVGGVPAQQFNEVAAEALAGRETIKALSNLSAAYFQQIQNLQAQLAQAQKNTDTQATCTAKVEKNNDGKTLDAKWVIQPKSKPPIK